MRAGMRASFLRAAWIAAVVCSLVVAPGRGGARQANAGEPDAAFVDRVIASLSIDERQCETVPMTKDFRWQ